MWLIYYVLWVYWKINEKPFTNNKVYQLNNHENIIQSKSSNSPKRKQKIESSHIYHLCIVSNYSALIYNIYTFPAMIFTQFMGKSHCYKTTETT